jgi:predicted Co/Zn/Cd cation transporter (cation efflux family)
MKTFAWCLLTIAFGFAGVWFLYQAIASLTKNWPMSSCLTGATALVGFAASYYSWKRRTPIVVLLAILFIVIAAAAAVFFSTGQ